MPIFYITDVTNRSWHIATLSNDKESTKPLWKKSNTQDKKKEVWLQRLWSAPCWRPIFLLSLFNIIFISRLIIFTLSLSAFQLVRKCSQKCFSIFHLLLSSFCSLSFFIISLSSSSSSSDFFSFFHLMAHTTTKMTAKNQWSRFLLKKMQNLQCLLCLIWSFLSMYFLCSLCSKLWWI